MTRTPRGNVEWNTYRLQDENHDYLTDEDGKKLIVFGASYVQDTEWEEDR